MRLDDIKDFQSLRSAWAILQSELKAYIKLPLYENDKGHTTNIHTVLAQFESEEKQEFYT